MAEPWWSEDFWIKESISDANLILNPIKITEEVEMVFLLHTQSFPDFSLEDDNSVLWSPGVQELQFYHGSIYLHLANAYTHHYHATEGFFSNAFDLLTSWSWQELHKVRCKDSYIG